MIQVDRARYAEAQCSRHMVAKDSAQPSIKM